MTDTIVKTDLTAGTISSAQRGCLRKFGDRIVKLGMRMACFDSDNKCIMKYPDGDADDLGRYSERISPPCKNDVCDSVLPIDGSVYGLCLCDTFSYFGSVIVDTAWSCDADDEETRLFCRDGNIDTSQADKFMNNSAAKRRYVEDFLVNFTQEFTDVEKVGQQFDMISTELARTYEELVLLYNMSTNMRVTQSNATYLQMACDQITQRVAVEGIAIFLEKKTSYTSSMVLIAGSGVVSIDPGMADILQIHLCSELHKGQDALLDSNVDSPFKYNWPGNIKNIIAVPLRGGDKMIGFLVATNIQNKPDFDSNEVKLFSSVANQCAVFVDNGKLFGDLKELFVGSLKALTSSIDAKDQYTRGHSERVAFISRWIAERYSEKHHLEKDYVHKVYLAGLLHDIGKIGIPEAVLCKNGMLDKDERNLIKSHPRIGATILSEIKQMSEVLEGALCHHERPDGKGYPDGLIGSQIPLIGKIISLADAFDAMTSRRVYRDAMDIDTAIDQIRRNTGTQFDEEVAKVFLESDVKKLWAIIQDGFIESWDYSNFAEYGAEAVGTLLR